MLIMVGYFFHLLVGLTIMPANISNILYLKFAGMELIAYFLLYERKYNINDRRMKKALVSGGAGFYRFASLYASDKRG